MIDTTKMRQNAYEMFLGLIDLGATTNGSTNIIIGPNRVAVENAEQARGAIKLWRVGMTARVETVLKEVAPSVLAEVLLLGLTVETNGGKVAYYLGNDTVNLDPFAKELLIQPSGQDLSNTDDSWKFWRAVGVTEFTFTGDNENPQEVAVTFEILPDFTKAPGKQLGVHNNHEISQGTPLGVWIATGARTQIPPKHLTAMSLDVQEKQQLQGFEFQGDISTAITAELDGAVADVDQTILVKNLTIPNSILVGDYVIVDSAGAKELVRIISVAPVSLTAATYGVERGVAGTLAVGHLTDLTFEKIEKPSVFNRTFDGTWESDNAAVVAGDVYTSNSQTKGQVSHASAGAANVTFTWASKSSPTVMTAL